MEQQEPEHMGNYTKPVLTCYGTIAEVSEGTKFSATDGNSSKGKT